MNICKIQPKQEMILYTMHDKKQGFTLPEAFKTVWGLIEYTREKKLLLDRYLIKKQAISRDKLGNLKFDPIRTVNI